MVVRDLRDLCAVSGVLHCVCPFSRSGPLPGEHSWCPQSVCESPPIGSTERPDVLGIQAERRPPGASQFLGGETRRRDRVARVLHAVVAVPQVGSRSLYRLATCRADLRYGRPPAVWPRQVPQIRSLKQHPGGESGLQVSGVAECCRSTVRNWCVTNRLVGGLCDSAWSWASFWVMRGCPPRSRPRRYRRTR